MLNKTINIISYSAKKNAIGGPEKVFTNTIKGLEKIGQHYTINEPIKENRYNWIHDSVAGFIEIVLSKKPSVTGPNLFVFPSELPLFLPQFVQNIYLHPSHWCIKMWKQLGFNKCQIYSWPAGIDLDEFAPSGLRLDNEVLLYYKKRKSIKVTEIYKILEDLNFTINLVNYGEYNTEQYKQALSRSSFGVWVGTTESQGIGLQEALATNLPLIVIENTNILDNNSPGIITYPSSTALIKGTSVPYWDERCGIIISGIEELESAVLKMKQSIKSYSPREFIAETLSLEKCAKQLVDFFDKLDYSEYDSAKPKRISILNILLYRFILSVQYLRKVLFKFKRHILNYLK